LGKAGSVSLDLLVQPLGGDTGEPCQVRVEHHAVPPNQVNQAGDHIHGHQILATRHTHHLFPGPNAICFLGITA
jgi:hypothetical protein